MAWVKLADNFCDHPKVLAAGPAAAWLFVASLCYANRYLTDGFVPTGAVRRLADVDDPTGLAATLVSVGLWERVSGGYAIHDYLDYQPSKEAVEAEREDARVRQAEWRSRNGKSHAVTNDVTNSVTDTGSNDVTNGVSSGAPARPGPGPGNRPGPAVTLPPNPLPARGEGERASRRRERVSSPKDDEAARGPSGQVDLSTLAELSDDDRAVWEATRELLRDTMSVANWERLVNRLEPLGRTPAGGLCLRAPAGDLIAARIRGPLGRALLDAGDAKAGAVVVVEEEVS